MPALATSLFTGAATIGIPIGTPPGRLNMAPNLTLNYNSYGGNGWIGQGWSIDMGAIQHSTKFGLNLRPNDYVAIANGSATELVARGGNLYAARIEGAFSRYEFISQTSGWIVTAKNGTKYYYGRSAAIRQDFDGSQYVFKWCLDYVEDFNGNYLTVTYTKDQGEIYLDKIEYTGNTGGPLPTNTVKFYLEEGRPDVPLMFTPNRQVKTAKRLKTIEIKAGSQLVRAYAFEYVASGSTGRSLLSRVLMYGSDASVNPSTGAVTQGQEAPLTPVTLSSDEGRTYYTIPQNPFYTNDIYSWESKHWAYGDFNGDGKLDIIYRKANSNQMQVKFSDGDGDFTDSQNLVDLNDIVQWGPAYLDYGDFDGDGKTDIIYRTNQNQNRIKFSNGNDGFADGTPFSTGDLYAVDPRYWAYGDFDGDGMTDIIYHTTTAYAKRIRFSRGRTQPFDDSALIYTYDAIDWAQTAWGYGDFNGDGKTDIIYHTNIPYLNRIKFSNGNGTFTDGPGFNIYDMLGDYRHWAYWSFADFNGDGKTDILYYTANPNFWTVKFSNGDGNFTDGPLFYIDDAFTYDYDPEGSRPPAYWGTGDFNGDGKTDLIYYTGAGGVAWRIRSSNGDGTFSEGSVFYANDAYVYSPPDSFTPPYWTYGDFNGDGKTDINYLTTTPYARRVLLADSSLDLPLYFTNAFGGVSSISYRPSSAYQNGVMPFVLQTVSTITTDDGNNNWGTTQYSYSGGKYNFLDRDFVGFSNVKQTNPDLTKVETSFRQDGAFKGLLDWQNTLDGTYPGNVYARTTNQYQSRAAYSGCTSPPGCTFPYLWETTNTLYDPSKPNASLQTTVSLTDPESYDSYGNVKKRTISGTGVPTKIEGTDYIPPDTTNWIVSLPASTFLKDVSGNDIARTTFTYHPGTINLWTKEDWNNSGSNRVTTFQNNYTYGNPGSIYDPNSNLTSISYDSTKTYPATITTSGFSKTFSKTIPQYDYRYGKPVIERDFNNQETLYEYDVFGRLKKVASPYDTLYQPTITYYYENFGQVGLQRVATHMREKSGTGNFTWNENYFDGYGRTIKTRTKGIDDNHTVVTKTQYNAMGRLYRSSFPYFEIANPSCGTNIYCTTSVYDTLGRVTQVTYPTNPATSVQRSYTLSETAPVRLTTVLMTDANGNKKEEDRDAYGRLVTVREYNDSAVYTTQYGYDLLNNLLSVTDHANNVTSMIYDSLSRKTSMNDPDMGSWSYVYNANGNLTSQTDAKGQTITFNYDDPLNRVRWKRYPGWPTVPDVVYTYDESRFGSYNQGRLTTVSDSSGTTTFYYDKLGRVTKEIKTITGSGSYTTETSYDAIVSFHNMRVRKGGIFLE